MEIINLNQDVLKGLEFFSKNRPAKLDLNQFKMPFVVGSEGAYFTGHNLFAGRSAIHANESNFKSLIDSYSEIIKQGLINDAVIISASGEKDAIWEIDYAKRNNLKTTLLTCSPESAGARIADQVIVYKKIAEPYTYNFSTYFGMVISVTGENPKKIKDFLKKLKISGHIKKSKYYSFILPDKYEYIAQMLKTKDDELFGPHSMVRAYTEGKARHAKFVVRSDKELVIGLGVKNKFFGQPDKRWDIKIPAWADTGFITSLGYYITGLVQENNLPYFKKHIENYCKDYGPKAYGKDDNFDPIVPGSKG
ncbi:MAG: hypothetical protein WCW77_04210 [Patescibacteria group bacterium]|jgi:hypothetical protein